MASASALPSLVGMQPRGGSIWERTVAGTPVGAREKAYTKVPHLASDTPEWWFSSVDHTRPEKSVSWVAGIVIGTLLVVDIVVLCDRIVPTLAVPFAVSSLFIGTVDALLWIRDARNQRMSDQQIAPVDLYNTCSILVERSCGCGMTNRYTKNPDENSELQKLAASNACAIFILTFGGHIFLLFLCAFLSEPNRVSITTLVATSLVIYALGLSLMLFDRWRYRVTPIQVLVLIALTLPAGILFSVDLSNSGFYFCAPFGGWCTQCGCDEWGVSWNATVCATST